MRAGCSSSTACRPGIPTTRGTSPRSAPTRPPSAAASRRPLSRGWGAESDRAPRHLASDCDKGWFRQVAANYFHAADPVRAQEMQRKAHDWNKYLFRPVAGIRYQRMIAKAGLQAENVATWVRKHTDPNAV